MKTRAVELILKRYVWALHLALIALGAFFLARTVNAFVYRGLRELPSADAPAPKASTVVPSALAHANPADNARTALERNLMQARRDDLVAKPDAPQAVDPNRILPCSITANLLSIVSSNESAWSYIIYRDPRTQDTGVYSPREGRNVLPGDITLLEVHPGELKLRKDNHVEVCILGEDPSKQTVTSTVAPPPATPSGGGEEGPVGEYGGGPGVRKVSEGEFVIEQAEVDRTMQNLNEVATDARIVPSFRDGKAEGFKLFSIRPGSVYQKIGLQNGDVIQKINGYEMNSPDKALEIYQKLRDAKNIVVQLERRGSSKTVTYQIR